MSKNNTLCPLCGDGVLTYQTRDVEYKFNGKLKMISQSGFFCNFCGDAILEPQDLKANRDLISSLRKNLK